MRKFFKITEYLYLFIALFLTVDTILNWNDPDAHHFLFIAITVMAYLMYFFKHWYRKKLERENPDK